MWLTKLFCGIDNIPKFANKVHVFAHIIQQQKLFYVQVLV